MCINLKMIESINLLTDPPANNSKPSDPESMSSKVYCHGVNVVSEKTTSNVKVLDWCILLIMTRKNIQNHILCHLRQSWFTSQIFRILNNVIDPSIKSNNLFTGIGKLKDMTVKLVAQKR